MEFNEFNRLPTDILKYITFLGATPTIDFDDGCLIIKGPFISQRYELYLIAKFKYDMIAKKIIDNIYLFDEDEKKSISFMNYSKDGAPYNIYFNVTDKNIEISFDNVCHVTLLPLFLLPSLKQALIKYRDYLIAVS